MTTTKTKFDLEKLAMVGNTQAICTIVSDLRRYRAAAGDLLAKRYADGGVDGVAMGSFALEVGDIEESGEGGEA